MRITTHFSFIVRLWAWVFCVAVGSVVNLDVSGKKGVGVIPSNARAFRGLLVSIFFH